MTLKKKILALVAFVTTIVATFLVCLYASTYYFQGKSLPSQSYLGESLGGQTYTELKSSIARLDNNLSQSQFTVKYKEESTKVFLQDILDQIESSEIPKEFLFYQGRPTSKQLLRDFFNPTHNTPSISLDDKKVASIFSSKLPNLTATINASLSPSGEIISEQEGLQVDIEDLKSQLQESSSKLIKPALQLKADPSKPEVTAKYLEPILVNATSLTESPISLQINDSTYELSLVNQLDRINFYKSEDNLTLSLDENFIIKFLEENVRSDVKVEPGKLVLTYNSETDRVDFSNDSKMGLDLDIEGSINSINQSIQSQLLNGQSTPAYLATLDVEPILEIDPILKDQGVKELIDTGYTTFRGSSSARIKNINVGMARFNGIIIQPGEEFSFNENLGPVDASAGYVPELVIKSFGTIPEYGGGLCQVSSTMYRAALFSGLEITERSNHSYAVGYYAQVLGHGLDATIYPGVKDLKFKNNTDSPIVVNSYAEGTSAYFKFYGSKKIDRVELVGPINSNYRYPGPQSVKVDPSLPAGTVKVMDTPVTGFNSYWERVIYDKDNNKTVEEIFSNYRAVNSKLVVSPDYYQSTETPEQNAEESATEA
jgi:hypothetical protein